MCGIVGVVIKSQGPNKFLDLLRISDIRGQDGTGVVVLKTQGIVEVFKSEERASKVAFTEGLLTDCNMAVGQARLSIFGLGHENDQPLMGERFIVVHNGNLYKFEEKFKELGLDRKLKVDTELVLQIFESCCTGSMRDTAKYVLDTVRGNMACLVLDQHAGQLVAFKHYKPLFKYEDETGIYFFSTEEIGREVFGIEAQFYELAEKEILVY